jgi:hypothetical protein
MSTEAITSMKQNGTVAEQISHDDDVYNLIVLPDEDRWLWFVTFTSTVPTDSPHWGRLLGCGDAVEEEDAWKRAKSLVEQRVPHLGMPPLRRPGPRAGR